MKSLKRKQQRCCCPFFMALSWQNRLTRQCKHLDWRINWPWPRGRIWPWVFSISIHRGQPARAAKNVWLLPKEADSSWQGALYLNKNKKHSYIPSMVLKRSAKPNELRKKNRNFPQIGRNWFFPALGREKTNSSLGRDWVFPSLGREKTNSDRFVESSDFSVNFHGVFQAFLNFCTNRTPDLMHRAWL